jgi:TRAP-type C4-dicarboxylate transport system permease small subunit
MPAADRASDRRTAGKTPQNSAGDEADKIGWVSKQHSCLLACPRGDIDIMKQSKVIKILYWFDQHLEESVLLACLILITILTSINVVLRYVFNMSLTWSEEICKLCLVTSGFYSLGYCIRFNKMIRVDAVIQLLGKKITVLAKYLSWVFMLIFLVFLVIGSFHVITKAIANVQINPALQIPIYITYMIPLSGCFLALFRIFQLFYLCIYDLIKGGK